MMKPPSLCNIPAKTLSDLVLGKEFWQKIFKTDPPERLDPNGPGIFLREVIATPHGFVTVHDHRQPSLHTVQHFVTIYIEGHGIEYIGGSRLPTAYAFDEGRCAYALGKHVFVLDTRAGGKKKLKVEHDLTGDVLTLSFRDGNSMLVSDAMGFAVCDIHEE